MVGEVEFTGGQVVPVLNLLPAIAFLALFIALYGKFRRALITAVALILILGAYLSMAANLEQSAVIVEELERLSGVMNAESHEAGVRISESWVRVAASTLALVGALTALYSLRRKDAGAAKSEVSVHASDNRALWDEQN